MIHPMPLPLPLLLSNSPRELLLQYLQHRPVPLAWPLRTGRSHGPRLSFCQGPRARRQSEIGRFCGTTACSHSRETGARAASLDHIRLNRVEDWICWGEGLEMPARGLLVAGCWLAGSGWL